MPPVADVIPILLSLVWFNHLLLPEVISLHINCSPDVLLIHKCPTAEGLADTVGSEVVTVTSLKPLRLVAP
jgi:hypothetical protein